MENLPIKSMNDLASIGQMLAKSGMCGAKTSEQGLVVAMTCHQQGITPLEFIKTFHIIDGKPSMKADAMAAEFRKRGGKYKILARTSEKAEAEFEFEGQKNTFEYTMKKAEKQGLCYTGSGQKKTNWQKFPENMLWARMMSNAVRVLCPEVNAGIYAPEEVEDFEPKIKKVNAVVEDVLSSETEETDYSVCPIEPFKNQKWLEMENEILRQAAKTENAAITDLHKNEILKVLKERKENEDMAKQSKNV